MKNYKSCQLRWDNKTPDDNEEDDNDYIDDVYIDDDDEPYTDDIADYIN